MRKSVAITFGLLFISVSAMAQTERAYVKGNSIVSAGVGVGNIWRTFLKEAYDYPTDTYNVSSNGTFTVMYEYGFSKRISAGIALGYSKVTGKFEGFGEKFTETLTNYSLLARSNYHFGKYRKFDPYVGIGVGYYNFQYYNNKPGIINSKAPGAFGYSGQLGTHYYFNHNLGAYMEIGYVGGSLG